MEETELREALEAFDSDFKYIKNVLIRIGKN